MFVFLEFEFPPSWASDGELCILATCTGKEDELAVEGRRILEPLTAAHVCELHY